MLLEALRELAPRTVLAVGPDAGALVKRHAAAHPECEPTRVDAYPGEPLPLEQGRRFDLGVAAGVLETLPKDRARALIASLRDQYCRAVLLLAPKGLWPLAEYLALGFERRSEDDAYELYWFDVDRYNPEREWNNPTNWANPENFRRFRW